MKYSKLFVRAISFFSTSPSTKSTQMTVSKVIKIQASDFCIKVIQITVIQKRVVFCARVTEDM